MLPCRLEDFELAGHARDLLDIPRVVAIEPPRVRMRGLFGEGVTIRYARKLKLPGTPRVVLLYHPFQYPLARSLVARFDGAELWYARPALDPPGERKDPVSEQLHEQDALAVERARMLLRVTNEGDPRTENEPFRRRLIELDVINARPFVPGARIRTK